MLCTVVGVVCLIAGGYLGARLGASAIINNWVNSQAGYAQSHILILRQLRNGDDDSAVEQLESQLDRDIVSLLPEFHGNYRLTDATRSRINAVLGQARQYRDDFPRQTSGKAIEDDVRHALADGEAK
jgi:hypothetical protein